MKKVIFLAIAAAAALTACSKSEVIDSKYGNDMIGFETYLGRDAQTKAVEATKENITKVGIYGFYTGRNEFNASESTANLWENLELTKSESAWTYDESETKYWTNATDLYTFLAYAPYATSDNGLVAAATDKKNPTVTYTCPVAEDGTLSTAIDLLYANAPATNGVGGHVNMVKAKVVSLKFNHALSRLNVTASAEANTMGIQFDVKKIALTGKFNTTGSLALATAKAGEDADMGWTTTTPEVATTYVFYNDNTNATIGEDGVATDALTATAVDYAAVKGGENAADYLMMIPTDFTTDKATLSVVYTTIYAGQESNPVTKNIEIANNFKMGKAYSINLAFDPVLDKIEFTVEEVAGWGTETAVNGNNTNNPEKYPAVTE